MNNKELITQIANERLEGVEVIKPFYKSTLGLPDYFRFGFEIEALIEHTKLNKAMNQYNAETLFNNRGFDAHEESTIEYEDNEFGGIDYSIGSEIVTPILKDSEDTWRDISLACDYLQKNASCVENCSVHINVGAQALGNNFRYWYNFLKIIAACEPEIYRYFADGKKIREHAINGSFRARYAMPIAQNVREGLKRCDSEGIQDINTLFNYCKFNGFDQDKKDKSISLKGLYKTDDTTIPYEDFDEPKYGRRIEIRMPNGTFDANLIQNYTYVAARIFEVARNLTPEQNKKLDAMLQEELPKKYNEDVSISKVLDVANFLFDSKEDKLQFLYTTCNRAKLEKKLTDRTEALDLIKKENMVLGLLPEELRRDRELVLEAVRHSGGELQYASEELKDDEEIVMTAVKKYGRALKDANERWRNNREIVTEAIKQNGNVLQYASKELQGIKEIAMEAVKQKPYALRYVSDELRGDKELALEAIRQNGLAVKFISDSLKSDKEIGKAAVEENIFALFYLNEDIMLDKELLSITYSDNKYFSELLRNGFVKNEDEFYRHIAGSTFMFKYLLKDALEGNTHSEKYLLHEIEENGSKVHLSESRKEDYKNMMEYILKRVNKDEHEDLWTKIMEIDEHIRNMYVIDER